MMTDDFKIVSSFSHILAFSFFLCVDI